MPPAGFEPTVSAGERAQSFSLPYHFENQNFTKIIVKNSSVTSYITLLLVCMEITALLSQNRKECLNSFLVEDRNLLQVLCGLERVIAGLNTMLG